MYLHKLDANPVHVVAHVVGILGKMGHLDQLDADRKNIMTDETASAIIKAARLLGNGDASTNLGAIEALGNAHREGMESIASSLYEIARAIETLSYAVDELKK